MNTVLGGFIFADFDLYDKIVLKEYMHICK